MRNIQVSNHKGQPPSPTLHHHDTPPLQPNPNPPLEKQKLQTNLKRLIPLILDGENIKLLL